MNPRLQSTVFLALAITFLATVCLGRGEAPVSSHARAAAPREIHSIADFFRKQDWGVRQPTRVDLTATLTAVDPSRRLVVIQEGDVAVGLQCDPTDLAAKPGDMLHIEAPDCYPVVPGVAGFPYRPTSVEWEDALETPPSWTSNYVSRHRAWLQPPVTGAYQLSISSDDTSELWLSDDERPEHARRIAAVLGWTEPREWSHYPAQRSEPVMLREGRRYYIEVLHEQGIGAGHVEVAWQGPTFAQSVIGADHLSPYSDANVRSSTPAPTHGALRESWDRSQVESIAALSPDPATTSVIQLREPRVTMIGKGSLPAPLRLEIAESLPVGGSFRRAEVVGVVDAVAAVGGSLDLELVDHDKRMAVHIQNWRGVELPHVRGYTVQLSGVFEAMHDAQGQLVAGALWIPEADAITIVSASAEWNRLPARYISDLANRATDFPESRIKIRGRIVSQSDPRSVIIEDEGCFTASYSTDGVTWTQVGSPVNVPMAEKVERGLAVTSHHNEQSATATFDQVGAFAQPPAGVKIGPSPAEGGFSRSGDEYTVSGRGEDIWERADQFYFVHQPLEGSGEIVARLKAVTMPSRWAKAGVMIRESLDDDAAFVDFVDVGEPRLSLQWRRAGAGSRANAVYVDRPPLPCWLRLTRRHFRIPAQLVEPQAFAAGTRVEVAGYFRSTPSPPRITNGFARPASVDGEKDGVRDRPLIDIATVLTSDLSNLPELFRLRGVVTTLRKENGVRQVALQDATGGMFIAREKSENLAGPSPGDFVDVQCGVVTDNGRREVSAEKILLLGRGTLPVALPHPMQYLMPAKGEGRWIETEGIVYSTSPNGGAVLRGTSGYYYAYVAKMTAEQWSGLIDAKVRIKGVASYLKSSELQLLAPGPETVEIIESTPSAALTRSRPIAELVAADRSQDPAHRVRTAGVVTLADDRLLIIEDETGAASIRTSQRVTARVGEQVDAFGFPDTNANASLDLSNATVQVLGPGKLPEPPSIALGDLLAGRYGVRLVTLDGLLDQQIITETGSILELHSGQRTLRAWCPRHGMALASIPAGSRVQLTGILFPEIRRAWIADPVDKPSASGFQFMARDSHDVVVRERPPWWRLRQALYAVAVLGVGLIIVILWVQILRSRIRERTRQLNATLERLTREIELSATLTERNRLAAEIHDSLEQGFSGLMLHIDATLRLPECPPDVRDGLVMARSMVAFSHAEVRHAVWDLQSPVLDGADLPTALRRIAQSTTTDSPRVTIESSGATFPLPSPLDHHVLRMAQEAITNAVKHAHASKVDVQLEYRPGAITLRIRDDGCGFDPDSILAGNGHFGLRSLRSRARRINGTLRVVSSPGTGTLVELTLPVAADAEVNSTPTANT